MAASEADIGDYVLYCEGEPRVAVHRERDQQPAVLRLAQRWTPYVKDGINDFVVAGRQDAVNPQRTGTKAAAHYQFDVGRDRPPSSGFG